MESGGLALLSWPSTRRRIALGTRQLAGPSPVERRVRLREEDSEMERCRQSEIGAPVNGICSESYLTPRHDLEAGFWCTGSPLHRDNITGTADPKAGFRDCLTLRFSGGP